MSRSPSASRSPAEIARFGTVRQPARPPDVDREGGGSSSTRLALQSPEAGRMSHGLLLVVELTILVLAIFLGSR